MPLNWPNQRSSSNRSAIQLPIQSSALGSPSSMPPHLSNPFAASLNQQFQNNQGLSVPVLNNFNGLYHLANCANIGPGQVPNLPKPAISQTSLQATNFNELNLQIQHHHQQQQQMLQEQLKNSSNLLSSYNNNNSNSQNNSASSSASQSPQSSPIGNLSNVNLQLYHNNLVNVLRAALAANGGMNMQQNNMADFSRTFNALASAQSLSQMSMPSPPMSDQSQMKGMSFDSASYTLARHQMMLENLKSEMEATKPAVKGNRLIAKSSDAAASVSSKSQQDGLEPSSLLKNSKKLSTSSPCIDKKASRRKGKNSDSVNSSMRSLSSNTPTHMSSSSSPTSSLSSTPPLKTDVSSPPAFKSPPPSPLSNSSKRMRTSSRQCDQEEEDYPAKIEVKIESSDLYDEGEEEEEEAIDVKETDDPDYDMQQQQQQQDEDDEDDGPTDDNLEAHDMSQQDEENTDESEDPGDSGHHFSLSQSPDISPNSSE